MTNDVESVVSVALESCIKIYFTKDIIAFAIYKDNPLLAFMPKKTDWHVDALEYSLDTVWKIGYNSNDGKTTYD